MLDQRITEERAFPIPLSKRRFLDVCSGIIPDWIEFVARYDSEESLELQQYTDTLQLQEEVVPDYILKEFDEAYNLMIDEWQTKRRPNPEQELERELERELVCQEYYNTEFLKEKDGEGFTNDYDYNVRLSNLWGYQLLRIYTKRSRLVEFTTRDGEVVNFISRWTPVGTYLLRGDEVRHTLYRKHSIPWDIAVRDVLDDLGYTVPGDHCVALLLKEIEKRGNGHKH